MLHKQLSKPAVSALAAGLMAAWLSSSVLADDGGAKPANDSGMQPVSTMLEGTDPRTQGLFQQADTAREHSLEKISSNPSERKPPSVGVFVARGHDLEEASEQDLVSIVNMLYGDNSIGDGFVNSAQVSGYTTIFYVFVNGNLKQYDLGTIERGIRTAKYDLDGEIKARRFADQMGLTLGKN